jgi:hypothetical protein
MQPGLSPLPDNMQNQVVKFTKENYGKVMLPTFETS